MATTYIIDFSSNNLEGLPGKAPITLLENTTDGSTSLTLTGKYLPTYGEIQQENFIGLLESFASKNSPINPTIGQLWYDTVEDYDADDPNPGRLMVYSVDGTWRNVVSLAARSDVLNSLGYTPVDTAGDVMTGHLTLNADPTDDLHAATKAYVDAVAAGLSAKDAARVATTENITLSGLQTIDGVTVVAGDRVLVKNQSTASQNGVYVAASGAWSRSSDMDGTPDNEVSGGDTVFVTSGTTQGGTFWVITNTSEIIVGTTAINWTQYGGPGTYLAGTGLQLTGKTFSNTGVLSLTGGTNIGVSASTGNITISVTGTVANATNATNATNASNVATSSSSTNSTFYPTFVSSQSGNNPILTDSHLTYNPSTNVLTSGTFVGALSGNASSATTATTAQNISGGVQGSIPYQLGSGNTTLLSPGSNGQILTLAGGVPTWATNNPTQLNGQSASYYLNANNINAGRIQSAARLGSGSASTSTWLRGDLTWTTVDAATLNGQSASFYRNASNLNAGSIPNARVPVGAVSQYASSVKFRNFPSKPGVNVTILSGSGPPSLAGSTDGDVWEYY